MPPATSICGQGALVPLLTLLKSDPRQTVTEQLMTSTLTNSVVDFALKQRLKTLCTPAATLHDTSEVRNCEPGTIQSNTELHAATEVPENVRSHGESPLQTKRALKLSV